MVVMTKEEIIKKITESSSLSLDEINNKIKQKMDQLAGLVSEDGAAHIVANELGVQLVPSTEGSLELKHLLDGMRNIEVTVKVTKKFEIKEFNSSRGPGKLAGFMIADKSGRMKATMWNDKVDEYYNSFNDGDVLQIKNAYARKNNYTGRVELNIGNQTEIKVNPEDTKVEVDTSAKRKKIADIDANDFLVEVLATIVQVSDIRFWETCSECNKKPKFEDDKYICSEHGEIPKDKLGSAYVLNCYIDDGSASIRTVFWKEQIQKLLNENHEKILKYKESPELFEEHKSDLLGEMIKVTGRINKNEAFDRTELVSTEIELNPDPEKEIKKMPEKTETKKEEKKENKEESETPKKEKTETKKDEEIPSLDDIEEINIDED
jgi:hypothetical protein